MQKMLKSNIWGIADMPLNESHQRTEDIFKPITVFDINRDNKNTLSVDSLLPTSLWSINKFFQFCNRKCFPLEHLYNDELNLNCVQEKTILTHSKLPPVYLPHFC